MTVETYEFISKPFHNKKALKLLLIMNQGISLAAFFSFPVLLFIVYRSSLIKGLRYCIGSGLCFIAVSIFRRVLNKKRPYEVLDISPLINKDTAGRSFPSRHLFSIFIIAALWCSVSLPVGICLLIGGVLLGMIRVIGGVHFFSDCAAGAIIGVLCGMAIIII